MVCLGSRPFLCFHSGPLCAEVDGNTDVGLREAGLSDIGLKNTELSRGPIEGTTFCFSTQKGPERLTLPCVIRRCASHEGCVRPFSLCHGRSFSEGFAVTPNTNI